jgi:hypothetical protein
MIFARTRIVLLVMLALSIAGSLAARARAEGLDGAEWLLEQPAAPPPPSGFEAAKFPIGLGRIGDIEFWAPNRGALITAGNGSTVLPGVWLYNGSSWRELATVCGASDGRIAWAGPDEFWTISDGRPGQAAESLGHPPPLEDDTLCHFALNGKGEALEVADSYATLGFQSNSYLPMHAAACLDSSDCWFAGEALKEPQIGAFQLHWNGRTVTAEPYLPEGHTVEDMRPFEGRLYESVRLKAGDRTLKNEGGVGEEPALHIINPEGVSPAFEAVLGIPLLKKGSEFPLALSSLHLSASEDALWAAAGPVSASETPAHSSEAGVTVVRYSKLQYSGESHEYTEEGAASWMQLVGPCPSLTGACEPEPPKLNPFPEQVVNSIAAEPATNSAWLALDSRADAQEPSPTARASLARLSADGTISAELQLPASGDPKGAAERIVCPAAHDCWMTTTQGWLFHLSTQEEREHPQLNTEPAFSGEYLITERPRDESVPQQASDALPVDDSGIEETRPSQPGAAVKAVPTNQFATVTVPLLSDLHTRLVHGTTLELRFHLSVKATVRLLAKRHAKVVASTATRTLTAGDRSLLLRLDIHRWPTKLDLQTHALAPLKTVSTRESGAETDTVTSSLAFPDTRGLLQSGLLGSGSLP